MKTAPASRPQRSKQEADAKGTRSTGCAGPTPEDCAAFISTSDTGLQAQRTHKGTGRPPSPTLYPDTRFLFTRRDHDICCLHALPVIFHGSISDTRTSIHIYDSVYASPFSPTVHTGEVRRRAPVLTLPHREELGTHRVLGLLASCPHGPCPFSASFPQSAQGTPEPGPSVPGPCLPWLLQGAHDSWVVLHLDFISGWLGLSPALTRALPLPNCLHPATRPLRTAGSFQERLLPGYHAHDPD